MIMMREQKKFFGTIFTLILQMDFRTEEVGENKEDDEAL